MTMIMSI